MLVTESLDADKWDPREVARTRPSLPFAHRRGGGQPLRRVTLGGIEVLRLGHDAAKGAVGDKRPRLTRQGRRSIRERASSDTFAKRRLGV